MSIFIILQVIEQLGLITQIPVDDVLDFATMIIENTL